MSRKYQLFTSIEEIEKEDRKIRFIEILALITGFLVAGYDSPTMSSTFIFIKVITYFFVLNTATFICMIVLTVAVYTMTKKKLPMNSAYFMMSLSFTWMFICYFILKGGIYFENVSEQGLVAITFVLMFFTSALAFFLMLTFIDDFISIVPALIDETNQLLKNNNVITFPLSIYLYIASLLIILDQISVLKNLTVLPILLILIIAAAKMIAFIDGETEPIKVKAPDFYELSISKRENFKRLLYANVIVNSLFSMLIFVSYYIEIILSNSTN